MSKALDVEKTVTERYSAGALEKVEELCCPVVYDKQYLKILPNEILERDYGCGDPSAYLKLGETVLDLGSGGGKICYIAAQVVGREGKVIGVDMNDEMLALANKYKREIGDTLGYHNVEFHKGRIQDLSMIGDGSIDVIVSNCVLNLVESGAKEQLFREMFRVLKKGGRAVISDIVSDETVPQALQENADLWSGCISGAFQEQDFLKAFEQAGFHGMSLLKRDSEPWRTVEGIEFRSVTVAAYKGKQGKCWETNKAVIYKGPWSTVKDDDNHVYERGMPTAVCEKTFQLLLSGPYAAQFEPVLPREAIAEGVKPFDCSRDQVRNPRETKGLEYRATEKSTGDSCCAPGSSC
jgi:arsenite methyltransferase